MITVCHPIDDQEVMFLRVALDAEEIPHFIVGENFGSIYPGVQISSFNERSIRVHEEHVEHALEIINEHRESYIPSFEKLNKTSKLRMFFELIVFGWVIQSGNKISSNKALKSDA